MMTERPCACGCGEVVRGAHRFRKYHDLRLRAMQHEPASPVEESLMRAARQVVAAPEPSRRKYVRSAGPAITVKTHSGKATVRFDEIAMMECGDDSCDGMVVLRSGAKLYMHRHIDREPRTTAVFLARALGDLPRPDSPYDELLYQWWKWLRRERAA